MSDNIDGFRRLLAGYKSTIHIALADANLRKSSITAESLEGYRDLVKTTTEDLEAHLQSIDEKLEPLIGHSIPPLTSDATELQLIKEERLSTQSCLQICTQLSKHIDLIQIKPERSFSSHGPVDPKALPEKFTNEGLQKCKDSLAHTVAKLEEHMKTLLDRLVARSRTTMTSEEEIADLVRLKDEWETTLQCMDICHKADKRFEENTSTVVNYATGDAVQFMVSTNERVINGTNRGLGWRTRQVGGHLSDATLQQMSRDFSSSRFLSTGYDNSSLRSNTTSIHDNAAEAGSSSDFKERYGQGFKLKSNPIQNINTPSTGSLEGGQSSPPKH